MKAKSLTVVLLLILFITNSSSCHSQNSENKIKLHSVSLGFGGFYFKKSNSEGGGASFVLNGTLESNKNLFNLCFLTGAEIGVVGGSTYNFNEISLAYGRELRLKKWFSLEGFAGIGSYQQNGKNSFVVSGNTISFPLKLNVKFFFNEKIGIGLNNAYSFNQINNNYSTNLIINYKF